MSAASSGEPRIEVLLERDPGTATTEAERRYGGPLRFAEGGSPHVFANFVSTLDGVVSLGLTDGSDSAVISRRHPADRFVMAMLRAAAGAVLIGAGTLAASPGHQWDHRWLWRGDGELLDAFRASCGLPPGPPPLLVISGSGRLPDHVALRDPAGSVAVLSSAAGVVRMSREHPGVRAVSASDGPELSGGAIVAAARREAQSSALLCEGGPRLIGTLLRDSLLHELFLSVSPVLAGRDDAAQRPGLISGQAQPPAALQDAQLRSVRSSGDLLLLRYALQR